MRIAVLGTGIMGAAMARNLARDGHEVRAWNRSPEKAEPLAADVLEPRKTFLTGAYARQAETTTGLGGILAGLALQDVPLSEFSRYAAGLGAVTPTQVGAALSGEIDPAQASIVIVGDAKAFLEPLRAKHPNVEVIPFTELDLASPTLRRAGSGAATAAR